MPCTGAVFQSYAYGAVPPVAFTVAEPLLPPVHDTSCWALITAESAAAGPAIVADVEVVQPFASVIVQVWVPASNALAVYPVCTGVVPHART